MQAPIEEAPGRSLGARRGAARLHALEVIARPPQLSPQLRQLGCRHAAELLMDNVSELHYYLASRVAGRDFSALLCCLAAERPDRASWRGEV